MPGRLEPRGCRAREFLYGDRLFVEGRADGVGVQSRPRCAGTGVIFLLLEEVLRETSVLHFACPCGCVGGLHVPTDALDGEVFVQAVGGVELHGQPSGPPSEPVPYDTQVGERALVAGAVADVPGGQGDGGLVQPDEGAVRLGRPYGMLADWATSKPWPTSPPRYRRPSGLRELTFPGEIGGADSIGPPRTDGLDSPERAPRGAADPATAAGVTDETPRERLMLSTVVAN